MKFKKAVALGLATMMIAGVATGCGEKEVQKPVEQQPVVEQPVEQEPVVQEPVVEARTAATENERLGMIIADAIGEDSGMTIETTNENGALEMLGLSEDMVSEYAVAYHPMEENYETVVVVKAKAIVDETVAEAVEGEAVVEGETTEVVEEAVPQTEATEETTDAVAETEAAVTADTETEEVAEAVEETTEAVEGTVEEVTEAVEVETNAEDIIAAIKAFHASRYEAAKDTEFATLIDNAVIFDEAGYIGIIISEDVANVHAALVDGIAAIEDIKIVPVVEEEVTEPVEGEATEGEAVEGETAETEEGTEEVENTEADNTDVNEAETSEETTETTEETEAE